MDSMEPIVPLDAMELIANGIDHAAGIGLTPDGTLYVSGETHRHTAVLPTHDQIGG